MSRMATDRLQVSGSFPQVGTTSPSASPWFRLRRLAGRRILHGSWDRMLWMCAIAAIVSAAACALLPPITDLVVFTWLMFLTSGPTATFLPSASEPILMAFGKLYPPTLLATVGVIGIGMVEWVNFRVFGVVMHSSAMKRVRSSRLAGSLATHFNRQPFVTTIVAAATPIPFWVVRVCGVLSNYPMSRFIGATAIGRFPRLWFFAYIGTTLPFESSVMLLGGALIVLLGAGVAATKRHRSSTLRRHKHTQTGLIHRPQPENE